VFTELGYGIKGSARRVFLNERNDTEMDKFVSFVGRAATGVGVGAVLGSAAIPAGATIWGGSRAVQELTDNEGAKEFFGVVGDLGKGAFTGGIVGGTLELAGKAIGGTSNIFADTPRVLKSYAAAEAKYSYLGSEMASKLAENAAIETSAKMGAGAGKFIDYSKTIFDSGSEIYKHREHKSRGIEYDYNCKVCN